MALTFLTGTKLILEDSANNGYEFLVSEVSVNQTYVESSRDVRTLHSKNLIKDTFIKEESTASFDFTVNLSDSDTVLMRWLGATESNDEYRLPTIKGSLLAGDDLMTIYIDSGNTIFRITNCVIETASLGLQKNSPLTFQVSGMGQARTEIVSLPSFSTYTLQGNLSTGSLNVTIDSIPVTNLAAVSFEITRTLAWLNQNTVQQGLSNTLYQKTIVTLLDSSMGGSVTKHKSDNTNITTTDKPIVIVYNNLFTISLDSCNFTDRWEVSDVFKLITDYKLLPTAVDPFIKF